MIRTSAQGTQRAGPRSGQAPRSAVLLTLVGGAVLTGLYFLVESATSQAADRSRPIESLSPSPDVASPPVEETQVELVAPDEVSDETASDPALATPVDQPDPSAALATAAEPTSALPLPLDRSRFLKPAIAEAAAAPPRVPPGPPLQYSKSESGSRETINPGRLRIDQFKKQQAKQGPDHVEPTLKKPRRARRDGSGGTGTSGG